MPLAFKDKPLTKQSFKLSPFASKILIKNVMSVSKTYVSKFWQDKSQIKRKTNFMKKMYIFQQIRYFFNHS